MFIQNDYIDSAAAQLICKACIQQIENGDNNEHSLYKQGQVAFNSETFMNDKTAISKAQSIFNQEWKRVRFHNLVRLGGDILSSGLGEYHKATILGALLYYATKTSKVESVCV